MNRSQGFSRREFVQVGMAGLAAAAVPMAVPVANAAKLHSVVNGLHIGIQTFSFKGLRYPELVGAIQQVGIGEAELFATQVEPTAAEQPDIFKWRENVSNDFFKAIRKKFNQAGIDIITYNPRFAAGGGGRGARGAAGANGAPAGPPPAAPPPITDAQIDRIFEVTKVLGAKSISSGMTVDLAKRVAPFAEKHKILLAVSSTNVDVLTQIPTISPWLRTDLDIGDFTRANGHDALQVVKDNYQHFLDIHLKDVKVGTGSVPFGTGDSKMKEILQFLRDKKTQVRANVDCDYPGTGTSVEEVKKSYDYVKSCLA